MVTEEEMKNMSPEQIMEMQKQQCIFCGMISGKMQSKKVYEDDAFIAILDIRPANAGHLLLIPKEHYNMMPQLPEDIINKLALVTKGLSNSMLKGLGATGTTIFIANGGPAGQRASHFMLHIIPRFKDDNLNIELPQRAIRDEDISMLQKRLVPFVNKAFGIEMDVSKGEDKSEPAKSEKKKEETKKSKEEDKKEKPKSAEDDLLAALGGEEKKDTEDKEKEEDDKEEENNSDNNNNNNGGSSSSGADLDAIAGLLK